MASLLVSKQMVHSNLVNTTGSKRKHFYFIYPLPILWLGWLGFSKRMELEWLSYNVNTEMKERTWDLPKNGMTLVYTWIDVWCLRCLLACMQVWISNHPHLSHISIAHACKIQAVNQVSSLCVIHRPKINMFHS